jgi:hypothetical protein
VASKSYKHSQNNNERNKQMKTVMQSMYSAIGVAFACFALLPKLQAVVPAPDGGYPRGNTAEGQNALFSLTTGGFNTAVGYFSLRSDTTARFNTGVGAGTLVFNTGDSNTAVGAAALLLNTASGSTAVGASALQSNSTGPGNTAVGYSALLANTTNGGSTATGYQALAASEGPGNTAVGYQALTSLTTGSNNTALGAGAGLNQTTGSNNIYIGDAGSGGENNVIRIGTFPPSGTNYTATYIGGVYDAVVSERIAYVNFAGRIGTLASSRRYKENIKPMDKASEALLSLKPVVFHYKQDIDPAHRLSFGLIAEEVAEISPDLVSRDNEGRPQTVRYEAVNAMLLNEFLKEHKKVEAQQSKIEKQQAAISQQDRKIQEQDATIAQLKQGMQLLTAQLKAQAAQIQKVSARLELRKFATGRIRDDGPARQAVARGR